jgi:hypothetical protein
MVRLIDSGDSLSIKKAEDINGEWIRMKMREEGFLSNILTPQPVDVDDLQHSVSSETYVKIEELEPESPQAVNVSFRQGPTDFYIRPRFVEVKFHRIQTRRAGKDVSELRAVKMDIRQIISDQSRKEMEYREDANFIEAVNAALIGANTVVPATGVIQWRSYTNAVTRETLADAMKTQIRTPNRIPATTALINEETKWDIVMMMRNEVGGDMAERWLREGFAESTFLGVRWLVTNKLDLVPTGTIYTFGPEKTLGKFYTLQEPTMVIKVEGPYAQFYAYEELGVLVANVAALGRIDLTGSRVTLVATA